jgi:hypothetical protein
MNRMPARSMTLYGVTARDGAQRSGSDDCLTLKALRSPEGESFSSATGRSLLVCAALAAGIAGLIISLGTSSNTVPPAQAATLAVVTMPKPRVNLAPPVLSRDVIEEDLAAAKGQFAAWRRPRSRRPIPSS